MYVFLLTSFVHFYFKGSDNLDSVYAFDVHTLEIGCKIECVCIFLFSMRRVHYVSKGIPDLEYIKTTWSALAETYFDPEDKGEFFSSA